MADYQRNMLLSVLVNEIDSSLDTRQQFNAYANYEDEEERDAENTQVLTRGVANTEDRSLKPVSP